MPALACAAMAACAALTACGDDSGTAAPASPAPATSATSSPAKDSPTGEKLVLRWRKTGGIAGLGRPGSLPEFSLYSTGRAVAASQNPQGKPTEYRLKPDAVRRLLDEARAAGLDRSHTVGSGEIADAITTVVTMGDATTRVVQPESQAGPEARFLKRLDPAGWSASDQAAEPRPYTPAKTAVLAGPATGGTVKNWPLEPLGKGAQVGAAVCTLAHPKKVPATGGEVAWRSEGKTYSVRLRPLLPGESSCQDLG
ncbi:hypothetical protein ACQPZP_11300 [Spirillospora sp. CA-142024]|uniref:hypothetical protein n=1 Tax=Spirillospora sp. CA-142024 TaxID=3240036 RepID=UPI003D8AB637